MKKVQIEFDELPFSTLERFGLTREMIEDLPMRVLETSATAGILPCFPCVSLTSMAGKSRAAAALPLSAWTTVRWMWCSIRH